MASEQKNVPLSPAQTPAQRQFILHWGEMSSRWGINRSVAQVHALLYLSEEPLNAEQISDQLSMARSNVSNCLRELQGWGIVHVVHRFGDRRDYYQSVTDVWDMFLSILEQRKRREIDPTVEILRECVDQHEAANAPDDFTLERMQGLLELLEMLTAWYEQMRSLSPDAQRRLLKMGKTLTRIVGEVSPARKGG